MLIFDYFNEALRNNSQIYYNMTSTSIENQKKEEKNFSLTQKNEDYVLADNFLSFNASSRKLFMSKMGGEE